MTIRVNVNPELLRWARERASVDINSVIKKFPAYCDWEAGNIKPTCRQLEDFAEFVYAPVGYFYLPAPPEETIPIPDFRTVDGDRPRRPSPNLIDTLDICQLRQDWYRNFAGREGEAPLTFVGSAKLNEDIKNVAAQIQNTLDFRPEHRADLDSWDEAMRHFVKRAEAAGMLVMVSGVVINNTHRTLDPDEFRGFSLSDDLAPLIFINGADAKAAQIFTLAHELAHVWLGRSALTGDSMDIGPKNQTETWCNSVAAELLVPEDVLQEQFRTNEELSATLARLAGVFKVSKLVALRRIYDIGWMSKHEFRNAFDREIRLAKARPISSGGNFYNTQRSRLGTRFARAIISDTLGGNTLFRDAFYLLGLSKMDTFNKLANHLGFEHGISA